MGTDILSSLRNYAACFRSPVRGLYFPRLRPLLCLFMLLTACSPISYRDASVENVPAPAAGPERTAHLAELKKVLAAYGTPVPMKDAPGFVVNSQEYSIQASLAGEKNLDLSVYWKPDVRSELRLPLVIADIRGRMAEVFAGSYTLQKKQ